MVEGLGTYLVENEVHELVGVRSSVPASVVLELYLGWGTCYVVLVVELGTLVVAASDLELGTYSVVALGIMETALVLVVVALFVVLVCFR
mgnify:CR=1 FL=1